MNTRETTANAEQLTAALEVAEEALENMCTARHVEANQTISMRKMTYADEPESARFTLSDPQ